MSDQPVAEAASHTTHNNHSRKTSMTPVGFDPTISAIRAAADLRLRPHVHRDRPVKDYMPQSRNVRKRRTLFERFDKNSALWDETLCIPVAGYACFGEMFPSIFRKNLELRLPRNLGKCKIKWRQIQEQVKLTLKRHGQAPRVPGVWGSQNF